MYHKSGIAYRYEADAAHRVPSPDVPGRGGRVTRNTATAADARCECSSKPDHVAHLSLVAKATNAKHICTRHAYIQLCMTRV